MLTCVSFQRSFKFHVITFVLSTALKTLETDKILFIHYDVWSYLHYFLLCTHGIFETPMFYQNRESSIWSWSKVMTALLHLEFPLPRLTLTLCILHEERLVLNMILAYYLNFGNQNNPYHCGVWKYLIVWVKIIIGNSFQNQFYLFLSNLVLHSCGLQPDLYPVTS